MAVSNGKRFITSYEIEEAIRKVQMGPEKKSKVMSERARKLTAYHEGGHAVVSEFLEHTDPVHYITIIPRGPSGGATYFRPKEDLENFHSYSELFEEIVVSLGGRVSERLFLDDISTGASGDIQQATNLARAMVTQFGMSERLGPHQLRLLRSQHLHRPRLRHHEELLRGDRRHHRRGGQAHL